ncbi:hypothetical protein WJX73_004297 [Symbiochloris irregularis]|uniref:Methyltransferase small domain-containing protein n=1 Tax=Symbiochloris irregularis TaxID=706552 RepID=A0AAW1NWA6_9CHLO
MKLKELESLLQTVDVFEEPKAELEQYPTGAHVAAVMLHMIEGSYQDLEGHFVVDLGCGTGMLSIGAAALGSQQVLGIDVDADALELAATNIEEAECSCSVDLLQASIADLEHCCPRLKAHTVIMNPPFGTRCKGADVAFLQAAFQIATHAVYSLHKSSTRGHLQRLADRLLGKGRAQVMCQINFDLPSSYGFHRERSKDIQVDLWRFQTAAS